VSGIVYLVGAGPGDPELITVRGLRCLKQADTVVFDRLVSPELLKEAPPGAEQIYVGKEPSPPAPLPAPPTQPRERGEKLGNSCFFLSPLSRKGGREAGRGAGGEGSCRWRQEEINALLISLAREGRIVVRLKGGDPFVFGRGAEEALACRAAGIPCEVVPGVTSAVGVPALAGIPLTHRAVAGSFGVVTGHCLGRDRIDWEALARLDTVVVLMGLARLAEVTGLLICGGRGADTPAAVISRGTLPGERVVVGTLEDIASLVEEAGLAAPATLVVGEVVSLREGLADGPAAGCHDAATISALFS